MLLSLDLTCFQQFSQKHISFTPGVNVIRAGNEKGKSTLIRAFMYALYGSRALNLKFADIVTWGRPESALKVEATLLVEGRTLRFIRSKGGAEVYIDDNNEPYVTGQEAVSEFAASVLGADRVLANRLMFANQNNLRGALEEGATEAYKMIEGLAEFDLFDELLNLINEYLATGSEKPLLAKRAQLEQARDDVQVEKVDLKAHNAVVADLDAQIAKASEQIDTELVPKLRVAQDKVAAAKSERSQYDLAQKALQAAKDRVAATAKHLEAQQEILALPDTTAALAELEKALKSAYESEARVTAYQRFKAIPTSEVEIECDEEALQAEVKASQDELSQYQAQRAKLSETAAVASSGIVESSDTCHACGQEIKDHKKILAKNEELRKQVEAAMAEMAKVDAQIVEIKQHLAALQGVQRVTAQIWEAVTRVAGLVEVDQSIMPPKVFWIGEVPTHIDYFTIEQMENEIAEIKTQQERVAQAKVLCAELETRLVEQQDEVVKAVAAVPSEEPENIEVLRDQEHKLDMQVTEARQVVAQLERRKAQANLEHAKAMAHIQLAQQERKNLQEQIDSLNLDLKDLNDNNELLKAVRAARPKVADKLWSMVLGAVSSMFTNIRGENSVVTKSAEGFEVNGNTTESLSGSTQDILGLAIRVALLRTFIPTATFLVLDEPSAAADANRAAALVAFVRSCEFGQVLLITHEDVSEGSADNLVFLEG